MGELITVPLIDVVWVTAADGVPPADAVLLMLTVYLYEVSLSRLSAAVKRVTALIVAWGAL